MKKLSVLSIILMLGSLIITAQQNHVPFKTIKKIADRNAKSLWGNVYPADPIPYYSIDDEVIAYRFNYSIDKQFPGKEIVKQECSDHALSGDKHSQWGGDGYGRILIGARENMAVIHEHSQCLSQDYALGYKFNELASKELGNNFTLKKIYYINHANQWHCYTNGSKEIYIKLFPPAKVVQKEEFYKIVEDQDKFYKEGIYKDAWQEYINGTITDDEGATKCDPSDPQTTTDGTWVLSADKKTLTIDYPDEDPISVTITSINDTSFSGTYIMEEDFGAGLVTYTITISMSRA